MAPIGISLHVGVNGIDPVHYQYKGRLQSCEKDAEAMAILAKSRGFQVKTPLLGPAAKADVVRSEIKDAAARIGTGGLFFLSLATHGGQVPSLEVPPDEDRDEICALYDRMLIDDELAELWTYFDAGARIVVVSDLCHSASITTNFSERLPEGFQRPVPAVALAGNVRALPVDVPLRTFWRFKDIDPKYPMIQQRAADRLKASPPQAAVITLSACQDNELARDGASNGLFTSKVLEVFDESPTFNYGTFMQRVRSRVAKENPDQHPKMTVLRDPKAKFSTQQVFSI